MTSPSLPLRNNFWSLPVVMTRSLRLVYFTSELDIDFSLSWKESDDIFLITIEGMGCD
jgi:hypothetical protein